MHFFETQVNWKCKMFYILGQCFVQKVWKIVSKRIKTLRDTNWLASRLMLKERRIHF